MSPPDAALFVDLDGVVLDVAERYWRLHCDLLAPAPPPVERAEYWASRRARRPLAEVLGRADTDAYRAAFLARVEAPAYLRHDTPVPGVREALAALGARHPLALVTLRSDRGALLAQLHDLDLFRAFRAVLSAPDPGRASWQSKRDLIRASPLCAPGATVVGDTETDVRAGQALGLRTVAVLTGLRNRALLEAAAPDLILDNLAALGDTL